MTDLDSLDPLGNDWKARGERGTARIRERAVLRDAGELVPLEGIEAVLVGLAGTVQGILSGIPDAARAAGAKPDLVARLGEIVADAQLQVSLAMDGAVDGAVQTVEEMEAALLDGVDEAVPAGPKERRDRTRKGKERDTIATTRPRVKRA